MTTTVVNRRWKEFDVYIGRGSIWGNPYTHLDGPTQAKFSVPTREDAIDAYEGWLRSQPDLMAKIPTLKDKVLGCYCKPQACHGDILARLADADD